MPTKFSIIKRFPIFTAIKRRNYSCSFIFGSHDDFDADHRGRRNSQYDESVFCVGIVCYYFEPLFGVKSAKENEFFHDEYTSDLGVYRNFSNASGWNY